MSQATTEIEDAELLARWREGDASAGDALVRRHFDSIHRFFSHRWGVDAVDLIQRTFLALCQSREAIPDDIGLRPYLFGIARKTLLMQQRRHARKEGKLERLGSVAGAHATLSRAAAEREEQRTLLVALRRLPLEVQLTIELHYWEGLTTEEIGHVLSVPSGTIKSRLSRARKRLQEEVLNVASSQEVAAATVRDFDAWAKSLRNLAPLSRLDADGDQDE